MSKILYYSKYCEHSKKLLLHINNNALQEDIHFLCIDKRVQDPATGKLYIILDSGEKIVMPENIESVPAFLLLNENYRVIYGDDIYTYFKPQIVEKVRESTQNNMEPSCFSFDSGGASLSGVMSDNYSFLDMTHDELGTKGTGGLRQMHNYVGLNEESSTIAAPTNDHNYKQPTGGQGMTIEQLQNQRDAEFKAMNTNQQGYGGGGQGI